MMADRRTEVEAMRYAVVIERAKGDLSAYVSGLPSCVAAGPDRRAV